MNESEDEEEGEEVGHRHRWRMCYVGCGSRHWAVYTKIDMFEWGNDDQPFSLGVPYSI